VLLSKSRLQHYSFAHLFLRDKAFGNPVTTVDLLSQENGAKYLQSLWITRGFATKDANDDFIGPDGIECSSFLAGDEYRGVIVKFPEPVGQPEAYFIAIVVPTEAKRDDKCSCRYFTLELSSAAPDATILGEWIGELHSNLGSGPPAAQGYFEKTVISRVLGTAYDPQQDQRRFEEWIDEANRLLSKKYICLEDADVDLIVDLSKDNRKSEFLDLLAELNKRPGRTAEQVAAREEAFRSALNEIIKLKMKATGLSYEEVKMELTLSDHDTAADIADEQALGF
jgi:hypothetical protein